MRLFFALWPDNRVRRRISRVTGEAVRAAGGRPVVAENFHITLAFLGDVANSRLSRLESMAGTVRAEPFELALGRAGYFAGPGALWLGLTVPCEALLRLRQGLAEALRRAALPIEPRPVVPHLTLARKARDVTASHPVKTIRWQVESFSLIRSVTDPRGAIYQELERWPLRTD